MSDLDQPYVPTWRRNLSKKFERERRQRRQRKVAITVVIAGVVGLVVTTGAVQFGWFAQDDSASDVIVDYYVPHSDCPDGEILYTTSVNGDTTECVTKEEHYRRQEQEKLAEVNRPIYGAMNNLQARFDAEPELSGKLSVILTTFCRSGVKYEILRDETDSPYWYAFHPEPVFSYDSSRPLGTFGLMAAALWEANWTAAAAGGMSPYFVNAADAACGDG